MAETTAATHSYIQFIYLFPFCLFIFGHDHLGNTLTIIYYLHFIR